MTPKKFRKLALSLPEAVENEHMGHPDFRIGGKIFATLFPDDGWGVLMITPELQNELVSESPDTFRPCNGAWGRAGATIVMLKDVDEGVALNAMMTAWRRKAPKSMQDLLD